MDLPGVGKIHRCPVALVQESPEAMEAIRFWIWKTDGFLPRSGGWEDQDNWLIEAAEIMRQSIEVVAAREEARRKKEREMRGY